jgi:hypothetical protein
LYLVENKIDKISFSDLLSEIKEQFKDKSNIFISSSMKKPFETQKSLVFSVVSSINRNHSFKVERNEKKKERYISLIPENALKYLRKMYKKYTSDNADIASISSEKSDDRFACQSEKKNTSFKFLGNKTVKKKIKKEKKQYKLKDKSFDSSIDSVDSDNEEYKYLKDNLKGKPAKDSDSLNMIFNNENMSQEENDDDIFNKDFSSRINNNITNFDSNPKDEIHNHISIVEENEKFLGSYKRSLQKVESKIEEKEKAMKKLDENKDNVKGLKNDLKAMHKILELKLKIVKNTTKNKYFGDTFEKNRINALAYKKISDSKIEDLKKGLKEIEALEKDIISKNKEIVNEFEKMKITDTGNKCFCKKEVNNDYNELLKKIKEDNKIIENCDDDDDFSNENKNNDIVNVIVEKLNDFSTKIEEEKEEF